MRRVLPLFVGLGLSACVSTDWVPSESGSADGRARGHAKFRGRLQVLIDDDFAAGTSKRRYELHDANGRRLELHFPHGRDRDDLKTGDELEIDGTSDGGSISAAEGDNAITVVGTRSGLEAAGLTGNRRVLTLLVSFANEASSCDADAVGAFMYGASSSVNALFADASFGALSISGDAIAVSIPYSSVAGVACTYSDLMSWGSLADTAARAVGKDPAGYDHVAYAFPPSSSSCLVGLGQMPGRLVWVGGNSCSMPDVYGHELGHNLGLGHASTPASSYADISDVMGFGLSGAGLNGIRTLNGPHKIQLGWVPTSRVQAVNASGSYAVAFLEDGQTSAAQVLKIARPGTTDSYFLSYRRPVGVDANLSWIESRFTSFVATSNKLSVHSHTGGGADTILHTALADGATFTDAAAGISVTAVSHDASGLVVQVAMGAPPPADTTAPTAAITAPSAGAVISGIVQVRVQASDDVGVARVTLSADGVALASLTTAPYDFSVNTTLLTNGVHGFVATAVDAAGNTGSAAASFDVQNAGPDGTPPSVSVTSPAPGATVSGVITVTANASDDVGVTRAELWIDGALRGSDTSSPFAFGLDTTTLANGGHGLEVRAYDAAGNSGAMGFNITVSNATADVTPPSASILSPAAGSVVSGAVSVQVGASDDRGVTRVELLVDGAAVASLSAAPYAFTVNSLGLANGDHTLAARAFDAAGNQGSSANVVVRVQNGVVDTTPPAVAITSPADGALIAARTTVSIAVRASDDTAVSRVEVLVNGALQCTTSAGGSCLWKIPGKRNRAYTLTARAFDAAGNVGSSAPVTITSR